MVRIEDDATYTGETLTWPAGVDQLTLLFADARRPVLELVPGSGSGASYDSLTLRGIALGGETVVLPSASESTFSSAPSRTTLPPSSPRSQAAHL